jgi:CBS domain containing-hemolysin-like protein
LNFEIMDMDGNRIDKVLVMSIPGSSPETEETGPEE